MDRENLRIIHRLIVKRNPDAETIVSVYDDTIRVDFVNIGEGLQGDYDPNNPEDVNLARFDVYVSNPDADEEYNDGWIEIEDSSYCTNNSVNTPVEEFERKAKIIHKEYKALFPTYEDYLNGPSAKKLGETLSWI